MTGCTRSRGPEDKAVVLAEGADLGIELGIKPVGLLHGGLQVIQNQSSRCATEVAKGTFNAAKEIVGGLAIDGLAVGLARVRQHDAEDMGSALAVGCVNRSTGPEVDLSLFPWLTFKAPEGKFLRRLEAAHKAADGVVTTLEAVFGREILVNVLGAQALVKLGLDDVSPRLAIARSTASLAAAVAGRTKRRDNCVCCDFKSNRAGGRIGWFWRLTGLLEVASDCLTIDVQLDGDSALGPSPAMKGQDDVYHGHFEAIRHGAAPGKGFPESLHGESASPR